MQAMAECSGPPQSTRKDALGTFHPSPEPVDSSTPSSAPLSRCPLLRHSSFVRAVCVDALVRICAGGDQRWSSLPRQLNGRFRIRRDLGQNPERIRQSAVKKAVSIVCTFETVATEPTPGASAPKTSKKTLSTIVASISPTIGKWKEAND